MTGFSRFQERIFIMMQLPFELDLKGKVAVVTGGGGVLCGMMAKAIAASGAKVAILDLRAENAQKVADEITADGGQAIGIAANVLEIESLKAAEKEITAKFGVCDILINGAGGNHPKGTTSKEYLEKVDLAGAVEGVTTFFDLDPQGVSFVFNLNFLGTLLPTQVFARHGGKRQWLYYQYFQHERLYSPYQDPGIQRCQSGHQQLYRMAGCPLCQSRHPRKRHCPRFLPDRPEPCAADQC